MSMILYQKFENGIDFFCQKIFGHRITANIREFVTHLTWSFFGGLLASTILLLTNILAGRWLGVAEYGKYNAVFALAQILLVFLLIGMDLSVVRKLVGGGEKRSDISASIGAVTMWVLVVGLVFFLVKDRIAFFFHMDTLLFSSAFLLGSLLAFRQLTDSIVRGLQWFKVQAFSRIFEALVVFFSFLLLVVLLKRTSFSSYIEALEIGSIILILIYLFCVRHYLSVFNFSHIKSLFTYGKIVFIAGLFGIIFGSLDKLAIARYLDFTQLGIYGAYYTASFLVVSQLGAIFDNVFFPTVARFKDDLAPLIKKVDHLSLVFFLPFLLGMSVIVTGVLTFFGSQYPLQWQYICLFSFLATLKMILIINTSLITAFSVNSLKLGLIYGNIINLLFIVLFLIYISSFPLSISIMATFLIAYTVILIMLNKWILYRVGFYRKTL